MFSFDPWFDVMELIDEEEALDFKVGRVEDGFVVVIVEFVEFVKVELLDVIAFQPDLFMVDIVCKDVFITFIASLALSVGGNKGLFIVEVDLGIVPGIRGLLIAVEVAAEVEVEVLLTFFLLIESNDKDVRSFTSSSSIHSFLLLFFMLVEGIKGVLFVKVLLIRVGAGDTTPGCFDMFNILK